MKAASAIKSSAAIGAVICLLLAPTEHRRAHAQTAFPLQRVQTIAMPNVSGRMDHLGVDVKGERLFAAALGNSQNTVEVIDLKAAKRIFSIRGQSMPQGVFYSADFKRLFVANGKDGTVKILGTASSLLRVCQSGPMQITSATIRQPNIFMSESAFRILAGEVWLPLTRGLISKLESSGPMPAPAVSRSKRRGREFSSRSPAYRRWASLTGRNANRLQRGP
jgi:hypothetical protein